jgi:hypothetical protein
MSPLTTLRLQHTVVDDRALPAPKAPLTELMCAEINADFFNSEVVPIPRG